MRIYTKTGDSGETSIIGGRVSKDDIRVEAYGTVDELNSFVGLIVAQLTGEQFADIKEDLEKIQHELFDCGGDLASISTRRQLKLTASAITYLEDRIDNFMEETPDLERFILPGGTEAAATVHIARTVTRRAERLVVTLMKTMEDIPEMPLKYLNRLSDYFFALARVINFRSNVADIEYIRSAKVFRTSKKGERNEREEN
ncbi:ATP--cob(I)alamin adenosyltransferase [Niallia circulans]|uniref:Corrinoid adenosyltransferase n=1 Tax=Niallia circulans TaxID=1397 RepID=A0A0J1I9R3_NIACI|nr:cob(I)yrinic acid a,c-diamide adenosyltransferase [Niallia circulans]KLV22692.1 ATP:cob(I)alamin adenosyltransferase [Niallia circulans]MDR4318281.1 cob(I)yrinic acid a,c-diamide adenosyltransferase [Niallia circulans]MED3840484.1 cob(I)yrinic acid a,c-diamide adenosyltransferase [Niallia circulans]MED4243181.1 cob(I)yrinic acid a,c-diamide adenosyltransferase [Niallia circulans]MED4250096.1 cob(I)yrinic acid a,c-diamide adenosyltransferase [Niallia circulans]